MPVSDVGRRCTTVRSGSTVLSNTTHDALPAKNAIRNWTLWLFLGARMKFTVVNATTDVDSAHQDTDMALALAHYNPTLSNLLNRQDVTQHIYTKCTKSLDWTEHMNDRSSYRRRRVEHLNIKALNRVIDCNYACLVLTCWCGILPKAFLMTYTPSEYYL